MGHILAASNVGIDAQQSRVIKIPPQHLVPYELQVRILIASPLGEEQLLAEKVHIGSSLHTLVALNRLAHPLC